jgi:hypothetical protein
MARLRSQTDILLPTDRGSVVSSTAAPTAPKVGQRWYKPETAVTYQYTSDGATSFWLDISSGGIGTSGEKSVDYAGDTDPLPTHNGGSATLSIGQVYYNREGNRYFTCTDASNNANVWDGRYAGWGGIQKTVTISSTHYRVHTFLSAGTFYMHEQKTCDILMVGGGGSGGNRHAGGGGAGGVLYKTGSTVAVGSYSFVIGVGGRGTYNNDDGGNGGGNTTGFGATAAGGGYGGGHTGSKLTGAAGGSGGGGGGTDNRAGGGVSGNNLGSAQMNGGTAYGNVGAYGWYPGSGSAAGTGHAGGGGGGAGAHGNVYGSASAYADENMRMTTNAIIAGGAGIQINIDGNNYYWGGGGGGSIYATNTYAGNGGLGGGGGGGTHLKYSTMTFRPGAGGGTAINSGQYGDGLQGGGEDSGGDGGRNTGGGGGGGAQVRPSCKGGNGGSGIVIVRYQIA